MPQSTPCRGGLLAVAVLAACFTMGCSTASPRTRTALNPGSSDQLKLTADEDRRARAIAHYGTALAITEEAGMSAALPEYLQAVELDPGNLPLALWLSQVYRSRHETTNAVSILQQTIKANPGSGEPWVALGITYGADDPTNALAAYKQALKIEPTHYGAVRALAELYLAQENTNEVVALLDQSFRKRSDESIYWVVLGDLYSEVLRQKPSLSGRIDRARDLQCYEKALALSPQDPDILARLGDSYMDANDFKAAAEAYSKLIDVRPNIPQLRERLAAIYLKTNQKEKAVSLYKELIKRDPSRYEFYNVLAELYEESDKPEAAFDYFEQSLTLNPNQADTYLAICELQRTLKRPKDALKTLETWRKMFPIDWRVPYIRAFIYVDDKDFTKAIESYTEAEKLAQDDEQEDDLKAQFYFSFGSACERAGNIDKAAPLFRKAIDLDPQLSNAYNYLGYMWAEHGTNLTESLALIQKAVQLEPDNGAFIDSLGWVYYKLGRADDALPQLRHAVELLEKDEKDDKRDKEDRLDDAVVYDHLAEVLLKLGKRTEAIQTWKRALEIDPDNKEIAAKFQQYNTDHSAAPK